MGFPLLNLYFKLKAPQNVTSSRLAGAAGSLKGCALKDVHAKIF